MYFLNILIKANYINIYSSHSAITSQGSKLTTRHVRCIFLPASMNFLNLIRLFSHFFSTKFVDFIYQDAILRWMPRYGVLVLLIPHYSATGPHMASLGRGRANFKKISGFSHVRSRSAPVKKYLASTSQKPQWLVLHIFGVISLHHSPSKSLKGHTSG